VHGVRDQLVQVVLNLVLNAIDATGKGGRIELRADPDPAGVCLRVQDTGPGVPSEHAQKLFQPYFTTKKHGTGLGLFVTRRLIEAHGGRIAYQPPAEGGACFVVILPVRAPES
jgi:signal transduction histidine kinase